jgi:hypothetical protein
MAGKLQIYADSGTVGMSSCSSVLLVCGFVTAIPGFPTDRPRILLGPAEPDFEGQERGSAPRIPICVNPPSQTLRRDRFCVHLRFVSSVFVSFVIFPYCDFRF